MITLFVACILVGAVCLGVAVGFAAGQDLSREERSGYVRQIRRLQEELAVRNVRVRR